MSMTHHLGYLQGYEVRRKIDTTIQEQPGGSGNLIRHEPTITYVALGIEDHPNPKICHCKIKPLTHTK